VEAVRNLNYAVSKRRVRKHSLKSQSMQIETKHITELIPAPYNPRTSTEKQGKHLTESLKKYGVVEPIVWNKRTGYIVGGHFRVRQLQEMGVTEVPCVVLDLNDEDERELNIRLNANTGSFNWDDLANEWDYQLLNDWGLATPDKWVDKDEEPKATEPKEVCPSCGK